MKTTITMVAVLMALTLSFTVFAASRPMQPPFVVLVDGPKAIAEGAVVEVKASVVRNTVSELPMELRVTVPDGATLVDGFASETIKDPVSTTIERVWKVKLGSVPSQDFKVEVIQRNGELSTRATGEYRFGRAAPRMTVPKMGKPLTVNGSTVLVPVQVTPEK
ncbi:MAG: hypothetical protein WC889_13130 [Myxococcota bacterium]|jgi:hypothetical protein